MKRGLKSQKAQIAIEYILIVGFVFLLIIPIFYYSLTSSSQNIRMNKAGDVVDTIAKTADMVYALGPGSQDFIQITMPGSVESVSFEGNEIILKVKIFKGMSDVFATSKANLTGYLSTSSGIKHVYVKSLDGKTVEIGEL